MNLRKAENVIVVNDICRWLIKDVDAVVGRDRFVISDGLMKSVKIR